MKSRQNLDAKIVISIIIAGLILTSSLLAEGDFALVCSASKTLTLSGSIISSSPINPSPSPTVTPSPTGGGGATPDFDTYSYTH